MAYGYRVLGQVAPITSNTLVDLYTVPNGYQTFGSVLSICNMGATTGTCRVSVRPAGITSDAKTYIIYDASINPVDSLMLTVGLSLRTTDVVSVQASTTSFSFVFSGSEVIIDTATALSVYTVATSSSVGMVRPDNTSMTINSGGVLTVIPGGTLIVATSSTFGAVRSDNTSITLNAGILSISSSYATKTSAVTTTTSWTITESSNGSLYFYYNGVAKFRFGGDGVISAVSNIGAYVVI